MTDVDVSTLPGAVPLSAEDAQKFRDLHSKRASISATLESAIQHAITTAHNLTTAVEDEAGKLWQHVLGKHGLDTDVEHSVDVLTDAPHIFPTAAFAEASAAEPVSGSVLVEGASLTTGSDVPVSGPAAEAAPVDEAAAEAAPVDEAAAPVVEEVPGVVQTAEVPGIVSVEGLPKSDESTAVDSTEENKPAE